ncbi:GNAT family N-acetyltransferase [Acanthopleuribacter pedis]|uniref:GNAT family N-acetyltransferase n=1 Tax=Acanthopleuribacter pedis TaxID=442870 RepID=A0A8J7U451_9BACT|nr:GNAT family N-acetyltransferase [Acanthopleuribacter pedis]MBO1320267.1 GNAT family N-acetyltransferase [Acanthopleuribacter pedis]
MTQPHPEFHLVRVTRPDYMVLAKELRHRIFVEEQEIPQALDHDGFDLHSMHVLVFADDEPVATGRWREEPETWADLSRIAVLKAYRGNGLGAMVVEALLAWAEEAGMQRAWLEPHAHLEAFYNGFGFERRGEGTEVAGHHLLRMERSLGPI